MGRRLMTAEEVREQVRRRKPTTCKLVEPETGLVEINGDEYWLEAWPQGPELLHLFKLRKLGEVGNNKEVQVQQCREFETYCDCEDAVYRDDALRACGRRCKHIEALDILRCFSERPTE